FSEAFCSACCRYTSKSCLYRLRRRESVTGQVQRFGPRRPTVRFTLDCRRRCIAANRRWGLLPDSGIAAKALLFDQLIGRGEKRRRNVEAEEPGRLKVDDELELGGLHDRQVS